MNLRFEIESLKSAIDALLMSYPELGADETLRADMFEAETELTSVLAQLLNKTNDADAMVKAISLQDNARNARKARFERQRDGLRSLMQSIMERAGLNKLVLPEATLSISYRKPVPTIADGTALPDECVKMVRKPDLATIKTWCESGNMPAGVVMSNGKSVLTVRVK